MPGPVRRVAVVGPPGAGTSTLVQALAGGAVAGPTNELDVASFVHQGTTVVLLDLPGEPELVAARTAGLRAADALLLVVSAELGLDAVSAQLWAQCESEGLPRLVAVTGVDRPRGDFDEAVALCQRLLDDEVLPLQVPMHDDDGTVAGVLRLVDQTVVDHSTGARRERTADPEHVTLVQEHRADLLEAVLAEAEDETLLDRYLDSEEPPLPALRDALHRGIADGQLHPALGVAPLLGVGLHELRELLALGTAEREPPLVTRPDGSPAAPLETDADGPLCVEVLSARWLLVRSGTLPAGEPVLVAGRGETTVDVSAAAGEVIAVAGLDARPGDTLCSPGDPLLLEPWDLPEPLHPVAVATVDDDLVARVAQDPGARLDGEVLWSQGERHAALLLDGRPIVPLQVADPGRRWDLTIELPTAFARTVASDLRGRDARDVRTEQEPEDEERSTVRAVLSEGELMTYAAALRGVAHGTARVRRAPADHPNG